MKRKDFLRNSLIISVGASLLPGFLTHAFAGPESYMGKRLIVIQLSGGNDGLNTIVPHSNNIYYQQRPKIGLKGDELIRLNSEFSMNAGLKELADLFYEGDLCLVNGVGYPNPNRSHFKSLDIWHSASLHGDKRSTGWIGRYLDAHCAQPMEAIEISKSLSLALKGRELSGMAIENPHTLSKIKSISGLLETSQPNLSLANESLGFLYKSAVSNQQSAAFIHEQIRKRISQSYFPASVLGRQLKSIDQFIRAGLETKIYYASMSGFDTHVFQKGSHKRLLSQFSQAMGALVKSLKSIGEWQNTLVLCFSEFGRRLKENGSRGTDHGTANCTFLLSGDLRKNGVYNSLPPLDQLDKEGDMKYVIDFRDIYAMIMSNWLNVDSTTIGLSTQNSLQIV